MALNIYGRPMFQGGAIRISSRPKRRPVRMQEGGGIEAVMPMDLGSLAEPPVPIAAPPPVEEALPRVEQAAANLAEEEVGNYAANMMSGLDAAEESGDPEDAINALRGNELPIEARYEELATYVGEEDAERTPESVLLMVQPTIMLTEEGALDSGIGSLMQNLVGEVEMETEAATPTPMGEGVGSLLMANQEVGQEPPVNFNYGGPVQRFSGGGPGGESEFMRSFIRRLSDPENLFITPDQRFSYAEDLKNIDQRAKGAGAMALMNIGLDLMSPSTGGSFMTNLGSAIKTSTKNLPRDIAYYDKVKRDIQKDITAQESAGKVAAFGAEKEIMKEIIKKRDKSGKFALLTSLTDHDESFDKIREGGNLEDLPKGGAAMSFWNLWDVAKKTFGEELSPNEQVFEELKVKEQALVARMLNAISAESGISHADARAMVENLVPVYFTSSVWKPRNYAAEAHRARTAARFFQDKSKTYARTLNDMVKSGESLASEVVSKYIRNRVTMKEVGLELAAYAHMLDPEKPKGRYKGDSETVSALADDVERKNRGEIQTPSDAGHTEEQKTPSEAEHTEEQKLLLKKLARAETLGAKNPETYIHPPTGGESPIGKYAIKPSTAVDPGYGVPNIFEVAEERGITVPRNRRNPRNENLARDLLLNNPRLQDEFAWNYFKGLEKAKGSKIKALLAYSGHKGNEESWKRYLNRFGDINF